MQPILPNVAFAFLLTLLSVQLLKQPACVLGLVDIPGERKHHLGAIPLIGGLAMWIGFLASAAVTLGEALQGYAGLLAAMTLLAGVGVYDDRRGISPRSRFLAQTAAVVLMAASGVYLGDLGDLFGSGRIELHGWVIPFTVFCVSGVINALNMADGLDGLAGGIALIVLFWLTLLALASGHHGTDALLLVLMAAVVAGFLCFNLRHPWRRRATVFMGDSGSMMLGFALAWFLVDLSQGTQRAFPPIVAVWIFGLPLMDTVATIIRRLARGRSPFAGDRGHLHHLLLAAGWPEQRVTLLLLLGAALLGGVGVCGWWLGVREWLLFYLFLSLFALYGCALGRLRRKVEHGLPEPRGLLSSRGAE